LTGGDEQYVISTEQNTNNPENDGNIDVIQLQP
jgi:hypothetical protein